MQKKTHTYNSWVASTLASIPLEVFEIRIVKEHIKTSNPPDRFFVLPGGSGMGVRREHCVERALLPVQRKV